MQERHIGKDVSLEFSANGVDWQVIGSAKEVVISWDLVDPASEPTANLKKHFPNKASLDEFLSQLGPLAYQSVSYDADMLTLTWRTLKLICVDTDGEWFTAGGRYEIKRETETHYLIRDHDGLMRAVDQQTMLAYGGRFEVEGVA